SSSCQGLAWLGPGIHELTARAAATSPKSERSCILPRRVASLRFRSLRANSWMPDPRPGMTFGGAATIASPRPDSVEGIPVLLAQSFLETLAKRTGQQSPKAWDDGLRRNEIL